MKKTLVLTGGGTAGHVMPSLALVPYLRPYFDEIHYIGSETGIEKELVTKYQSIFYHAVDCIKLRRGLDYRNLAIPFKLASGKAQAKKLLKEINPAVIFSKGGFVSLPTALSCGKIPLILHESDMSLGLANKICIKKCALLLTAFPTIETQEVKTFAVGSPIRSNIYLGNASRVAPASLKPVLLVIGGSIGSSAINKAVRESLPYLTQKFFVYHIVGRGNLDYNISDKGYSQIDFTNNIEDYFALADVVISRGGANTLFELIALRKPTLVIPLPKSKSSRGDQEENAQYFANYGYTRTLLQQNLSSSSLVSAVNSLYDDRDTLISKLSEATDIDGTRRIVDYILSLAKIK